MSSKQTKLNFFIFLFFLLNKITIQSSDLETVLQDFISDQIVNAINNTIINCTNETNENETTIKYYLVGNNYNETNSSSIQNLISYSSRSKGELFSSKNCIENKNYAFYTINAYNIHNSEECPDCPKLSYIFGLCISNESQGDKILDNFVKNMIIKINDCNNNTLGFDNITIENKIEKKDSSYSVGFWLLIIVIFFILSLSILTFIYYFIFSICSKSKKIYFLESFKFKKNTGEFFSLEETTNIYNDIGLAFIRGLRGIAIILYIFGIVFLVFIKYPAKVTNEDIDYIGIIKSFGFFFFRYGIVNAPRLLLALSGFCCSYKFYMFLDDELRSILEQENRRSSDIKSLDVAQETRPILESVASFTVEKEEKEENEENLGTDFDIKIEQYNNSNSNEKNEQSSENVLNKAVQIETNCGNITFKLDEQKQHLLTVKYMFKFFFFQTNKIFLCIFVIFIIRFLLSCLLENKDSPMVQILYKHHYKNRTLFDHLSFLLLFGNFLLSNIMDNSKNETSLSTFSLIYNEIFFFVIFIPILFVIYRKRIKVRNLLFLIIIFDVIRFFFYYSRLFDYYKPNDEIIENKKQRVTNRFIFRNSFIDLYSKWPFFNINYYLIGILFGLMQYSLQKNTGESYNGYLNIVVDLLYFIKYQSEFAIKIFCWVSGIIILLFQFSQLLITLISDKTKIFFRDEYSFIDFLYLIEGNVVVILTILIPFTLYIKGSNFFTYFLSSSFWLIFNKMYFSLALTAETVIFWFFYRSDTNYQLNLFSYTYFGFVSLIIVFVISFFCCIFIEFPLKRIIHSIIEKKDQMYAILDEKDIKESLNN